MAQAYTSNRIIFEKGKQAKFIIDCKSKLCMTWIDFAKLIGVNCRTLRDWSKEKKKMPYDVALWLAKDNEVILPKKVKIMRWSDHLKAISKRGGIAHHNKYGRIGNKTDRERAWRKWWDNKGKYKKIAIFERKEINIPTKDARLAEFVGIMIGDGCISDYALRITLDTLVDKDYISYVVKLLKYLFNVDPTIFVHTDSRATDIIIQRKNLIDFCINIGLNIGHKIRQNIDVPVWVKSDNEFSIACVRGLFDTDGCIFNHRYIVHKREYNYTKIAFTNKCPLVIKFVKDILLKLGFCVRISKNGNDVRIESKKDVQRYVDIIGTSNPKFLDKITKGDVLERSNKHLC